jgi:hypothetical protein
MIVEDGYCRWPRGCQQSVSQLDRGDGLCYYHAKIKAGLFDPRDILVGGRKTIYASDVVSDEQHELARALRQMGAEPEVVRMALAKQQPRASGGTKGTGVKQGRLADFAQ